MNKKGKKKNKVNLAILASGEGTGANRLFNDFLNSEYSINVLISSKSDSLVLQKAKAYNIPSVICKGGDMGTHMLEVLHSYNIEWVILCGFLRKLSPKVIDSFPKRVINIHPSILPKYGGKGYYGNAVHQAVIDAKDSYSGITIHYANKEYDEGNIIFQKRIPIDPYNLTAEKLSGIVKSVEHAYYSKVISETIKNNSNIT